MMFELHCHTHHSRGTKIPAEVMLSPAEVVRLAGKKGIDGLAVTDHGVVSGWEEARREARKQGIMFIPGIEVETMEGHLIGLGLTEAVENGLSLEETLEGIREQGGLSVAPHPYDIRSCGVGDLCMKADAVEVFNSLGMDRLSNWYTRWKVAGTGKPQVVGSDVHMAEMMGLSLNFAYAQDMDGLFREIRRGRVGFRTACVPVGPVVNWSRERLTRSYSEVLEYIDRNYGQPKAWLSRRLLSSFVGSRSRAWNALGGFAVGCTAFYSGVKLLTY